MIELAALAAERTGEEQPDGGDAEGEHPDGCDCSECPDPYSCGPCHGSGGGDEPSTRCLYCGGAGTRRHRAAEDDRDWDAEADYRRYECWRED